LRVGGVWRVEVVTFVRSIAAEAAIWTVGFAPLDSVIGVVVADVPGVTLCTQAESTRFGVLGQ